LLRLDTNRLVLVKMGYDSRKNAEAASSRVIDLRQLKASKNPSSNAFVGNEASAPPTASKVDLKAATIEIRTVERRQVYVDGQPVGDPIE